MGAKYSPERLDQEREVLELRRAGLTYDDIARHQGCTPETASARYKRAIRRTLAAAGADELRDLELDRLDRLQRAVWARALQADLPAVATALRIMEQRAKLLGLNAPEKHQVEVGVFDAATVDAEVARLAAMLGGNIQAALPAPSLPEEIIEGEIVDYTELS